MMQILYKLQIVNIIFTLSLYTESMKTLFLMLIITFLIKPFQLSTVYFVLFLYFLAKKDYETMYIEKYWVFPSILLLFFCSSYVPLLNRICTSLSFLFVSGIIKLIKSDWIGSADVCYLTFFGFYLGIERMLVALYISVLLGILWILYKKKAYPSICIMLMHWCMDCDFERIHSILFSNKSFFLRTSNIYIIKLNMMTLK